MAEIDHNKMLTNLISLQHKLTAPMVNPFFRRRSRRGPKPKWVNPCGINPKYIKNHALQVQGDQLNMAVWFWYLLKRDLPSVHICTVAYTSVTFYKEAEQHGLQRNTKREKSNESMIISIVRAFHPIHN